MWFGILYAPHAFHRADVDTIIPQIGNEGDADDSGVDVTGDNNSITDVSDSCNDNRF